MSLKNHIVWRVGVVYIGIFVLSLVIVGKLFIIIYVEGSKWEEKAEEHNMKYVTIDPNRGISLLMMVACLPVRFHIMRLGWI